MTDLFSKFDPLIETREQLLATGLTDPFNLVMERVVSPTVAICNGRETVLLGTYNYMGMTFDQDVIAAGKQALDEYGSGTTGSRVLNGTYAGHKACEEALKDFYAMDHAMVFSTGYQANLGIISTIAGKDDYIVLDIDSHASIYDGCALGNANIVPFRHNDIDALEKRLKRLPEGAGVLVVLEGVYSMLGDIAPLKEMVAVSKAHGAMVLVDEAHSMGFIGEHGRGVAEAQGCIDDVDFIIGTFSKSVGTVGGFCVSNHPKFEIMRLVCRPYVFTASLPPSVVATAATSIRKLMHGADKRAHLWENSKKLHAGLKALGFQLGTDEPQSAIIAVIMPDLEKGAAMWEALLHEGLYVNLARPPATPANMTLLRCSLCAEHSSEQVDQILGMFEAAGRATGCIG
ncbi:aminotransferase class I/II-fold pyridoxal phosphate-dependent enzyme [Sphingomonas rhizophila]|uniref:Aminotransferase class I/II-fold pyridoxal phosphate-dependent enzyme n=1 Tax=Sphingomonas rhizophila TaxID=2071607 RepID=A0A7G9SBI9_9SPHN|nr:aminotransferase class I/II-fold pyridoxal phosphate-dependent enzyme [Sphingomonas rhizophila]QNN65214.1 aminotransferase class I/II-fold pyridoxal phosphate-dependent enzyme [Sphingomonas rhizophila]